MLDLLKHAKFWLFAAVAVGFSILALVVRGLLQQKTDPSDVGFAGLPKAPAPIQQAADNAYEASLTIKATTKAATEAQKTQLTEIGKMDDKKARRQALANFVQGS